jgi:hypothetical protein
MPARSISTIFRLRGLNARAVSFDVTSVLARLRHNGSINQRLAVTFVPDSPPEENSDPIVGRLKLMIP